MVPTVVQVKPNNDFTVYVYFGDGKIKLFDMEPIIKKGGVFKQISSAKDFVEKCTVLGGTLAWDTGGNFDPHHCLDIAPETVYVEGKDVADPLEY